MEFEFPPKNPHEAYLEAHQKLKDKGYAFSDEKKLCKFKDGKIVKDSGFVFEVKKGTKFLFEKRPNLLF